MARNPIIHNTKGIHRYLDFVSQVPDFIKAEEDVVTFLQVLSDYLNNAYRNITTVEKFSFKFIALDSNYGAVLKKANQLVDMFNKSAERNVKVLYLSYPQGNPLNPDRPLYIEYIKYAGDLDRISPNIINVPKVNGDKVYIEFTDATQADNSGVYFYDGVNNQLVRSVAGSVQDPFNNTPDKPLVTDVTTYAPRMLEFNVSDVSGVQARRASSLDPLVYYEISFNARITNISDVKSVYTISQDINEDGSDEKILIDYYGYVNPVPSTYDESYSINFVEGCESFAWSGLEQGKGLFYFKELTQSELSSNRTSGLTKYIDPMYEPNTNIFSISQITSTSDSITLKFSSDVFNLVAGDRLSLFNAGSYDGSDYVVESRINARQIKLANPFGVALGVYNGGKAIIRNLYYSKDIGTSEYYRLVEYDSFIGSTEFSVGDIIARVNDEYEQYSTTIDASTDFDSSTDYLYPSDISDFIIGDYVVLREDSGANLPTGTLVDGEVYKIIDLVSASDVNNTTNKNKLKLESQSITGAGTGTINIVKLDRYFDATAVSITDNELYLNDINGLQVGDYIRVEGETTGLTLPVGLSEDTIYIIEDINQDTNAVKLYDVLLTVAGIGNMNFIKMIPDARNRGKIQSVSVATPLSTGKLQLDSYVGDLISQGRIINMSKRMDVPQVASIITTSQQWEPEEGKVYTKGENYTYRISDKNMVFNYRVIKTHTYTSGQTKSPDFNNEYYEVAMEDFRITKTKVDTNPYMFGMYRVYSLDFDQEITYDNVASGTASDLYIQKEEDLRLVYGHDQREFVFDPRFAPQDKLTRNGFMEIIQSNASDDAVVADIDQYVSANTTSAVLLSGLVVDIPFNITSLSESDLVVTAVTVYPHIYITGMHITISGASDSAYNGEYIITVIDSNTFTYTVASSASGPITGPSIALSTYRNTIETNIDNITRSGDVVTVITDEDHGYKNGISVTIEGAVEPEFNGTFIIYDVTANSFKYTSAGASAVATTLTQLHSIYQPIEGDYINVLNQPNSSDNGIYIVSSDRWQPYDNSKISNQCVLFTRQNLFDVSDTNPVLASALDRYAVKSLRIISGRTVRVDLYEPHSYIVGSTVNILGADQVDYNGRYEVSTIISDTSFTYKIPGNISVKSPATGNITCNGNGWYKYTISSIDWQKKSNYSALYYTISISDLNGDGAVVTVNTNTNHNFSVGDYAIIENTSLFDGTYKVISVPSSTEFTFFSGISGEETQVGIVTNGIVISSNNNKDNVSKLSGEYTFTADSGDSYLFRDGLVVELNDQLISSENGRYRVQKNAKWKRLDRRLVMKIGDINVDAYENPEYLGGLAEDEIPYVYRVFNDAEVNEYIADNFTANFNVFKVDAPYATNYQFVFEKVSNIDTTKSYHELFDSRYDKNSVVDTSDMKATFDGIPDMDYPILEKVERLVYLKDPNVIDIDLIGYLARYMGYDITSVFNDITSSPYYVSNEEQEKALRKYIENLPQYYALKSTESGIEMLLLAFGIVGELVTLWTKDDNPYAQFERDVDIRNVQYAAMESGEMSNYIPTPYFDLKVEVEGNFDAQLLSNDLKNVEKAVRTFKPINTVFRAIYLFLETKANIKITSSKMKAKGKLSASIGYDNLVFDDEINNDCI